MKRVHAIPMTSGDEYEALTRWAAYLSLEAWYPESDQALLQPKAAEGSGRRSVLNYGVMPGNWS